MWDWICYKQQQLLKINKLLAWVVIHTITKVLKINPFKLINKHTHKEHKLMLCRQEQLNKNKKKT